MSIQETISAFIKQMTAIGILLVTVYLCLLIKHYNSTSVNHLEETPQRATLQASDVNMSNKLNTNQSITDCPEQTSSVENQSEELKQILESISNVRNAKITQKERIHSLRAEDKRMTDNMQSKEYSLLPTRDLKSNEAESLQTSKNEPAVIFQRPIVMRKPPTPISSFSRFELISKKNEIFSKTVTSSKKTNRFEEKAIAEDYKEVEYLKNSTFQGKCPIALDSSLEEMFTCKEVDVPICNLEDIVPTHENKERNEPKIRSGTFKVPIRRSLRDTIKKENENQQEKNRKQVIGDNEVIVEGMEKNSQKQVLTVKGEPEKEVRKIEETQSELNGKEQEENKSELNGKEQEENKSELNLTKQEEASSNLNEMESNQRERTKVTFEIQKEDPDIIQRRQQVAKIEQQKFLAQSDESLHQKKTFMCCFPSGKISKKVK